MKAIREETPFSTHDSLGALASSRRDGQNPADAGTMPAVPGHDSEERDRKTDFS
jgi:hypothetical protein